MSCTGEHLAAVLTADTIVWQLERQMVEDAKYNLRNIRGLSMFGAVKTHLKTQYVWQKIEPVVSQVESERGFKERIHANQFKF